jgi:hypothetical protein
MATRWYTIANSHANKFHLQCQHNIANASGCQHGTNNNVSRFHANAIAKDDTSVCHWVSLAFLFLNTLPDSYGMKGLASFFLLALDTPTKN